MIATLPSRRDESQDLCSRVGAEDKECYANATEAMHELPDDQFPGITYVEGWAKIHEIPILANHAWLELADGSLIDPIPDAHPTTRPLRH